MNTQPSDRLISMRLRLDHQAVVQFDQPHALFFCYYCSGSLSSRVNLDLGVGLPILGERKAEESLKCSPIARFACRSDTGQCLSTCRFTCFQQPGSRSGRSSRQRPKVFLLIPRPLDTPA
jgi:hypothetical protein